MSRKLNLGDSSEYPKLVTSERGTVYSFAPSTNFIADRNGITWYNTPYENGEESVASSQQDLHQVAEVIENLDREGEFDTLYNVHVARCLEFGFLVEVAGNFQSFWDDNTVAMSEEFLEDAFGYRLDYSLNAALAMVKPMSAWPAGRRLGALKLRFALTVEGKTAALLSFTTRSIVLSYTIEGRPYEFFLGFHDYSELATNDVGKYDWYAACWKHLFYQVLATCGIHHNEFQFFYLEGLKPNDPLVFNGEGMVPIRASNPTDILQELDNYLEVWRATKMVY